MYSAIMHFAKFFVQMDFRKRPRKDTLYVSKRHLRRLAAQEAANFTKNVVHKKKVLCRMIILNA